MHLPLRTNQNQDIKSSLFQTVKHARLHVVVKYSHCLCVPPRTIQDPQLWFLLYNEKRNQHLQIHTVCYKQLKIAQIICCVIPYVILEVHSPIVLLLGAFEELTNEEFSCVLCLSNKKRIMSQNVFFTLPI